jgi:hypothetical protein
LAIWTLGWHYESSFVAGSKFNDRAEDFWDNVAGFANYDGVAD